MSNQIIRRSMVGLVAGMLVFALGGSALAKSLDGPTITSISPRSAQPGKIMIIRGSALTGATVTFQKSQPGQQPVPATQAETIVSPGGTRILLTIPDGGDAANGLIAPSGVDQLVVTTPGGTTTRPVTVLALTRHAMKPIISGVMPRNAHPGQRVTIKGSNLNGATAVWLSGTKAIFTVPSSSKILAIVPKHAKTGRWSVRTGVGTTGSPRFKVLTTSA